MFVQFLLLFFICFSLIQSFRKCTQGQKALVDFKLGQEQMCKVAENGLVDILRYLSIGSREQREFGESRQ